MEPSAQSTLLSVTCKNQQRASQQASAGSGRAQGQSTGDAPPSSTCAASMRPAANAHATCSNSSSSNRHSKLAAQEQHASVTPCARLHAAGDTHARHRAHIHRAPWFSLRAAQARRGALAGAALCICCAPCIASLGCARLWVLVLHKARAAFEERMPEPQVVHG